MVRRRLPFARTFRPKDRPLRQFFGALFIIAYVAVLTCGNVCHVLRAGADAHPLMYFIVWDMFSGWSAFDLRTHIIAEGQGNRFYELSPPPWGDVQTHGYASRASYDKFQNYTPRMGLNVLKHTRHEPIKRIFIVEDWWAKKFNIKDRIWERHFDLPKDPQHYFWRRVTLLPNGKILDYSAPWLEVQARHMLLGNPKLSRPSEGGIARAGFDVLDAPADDELTAP